MPEIPDHISFLELVKLSNTAPKGMSELDAKEYLFACSEIYKQLEAISDQMATIQSHTVGQERQQQFKLARRMIVRAQSLLKKSTST